MGIAIMKAWAAWMSVLGRTITPTLVESLIIFRVRISITAWRKLCQEQARGEPQTREHARRAVAARLNVEI